MTLTQQELDRILTFTDATERDVEIPFVFNNLPEEKIKILDVACAYSQVLNILNEHGYNAYGIDLLPYDQEGLGKFVYADARDIPFKDEWFDMITCISSLEHFGLVETPYNTDATYDPTAGIAAMNEMYRILKHEGKLILTLPYGFSKNNDLLKWIKFFNREELRKIIDPNKWTIERVLISKYVGDPSTRNGQWVPTTWEEGEGIETFDKVICNISLLLRKVQR